MIAISRLRFPHGISGRDIDAFARAALGPRVKIINTAQATVWARSVGA